MKSPEALAKQLSKQWENADLRESRVLHGKNLPIRLPIGKPSPSLVQRDVTALSQHLKQWRKVSIGKVLTTETTYRSLGQAVELPTHWEIPTVEDWIAACDSKQVASEHQNLRHLLEQSDSIFHSYFLRRRASWRGKEHDEIIQAIELANTLTPNIAKGAPLRSISLAGIDTKFFERHRQLISDLLDLRYAGKISELGLENFLGAWHDNDHWVLVSDLGNKLHPFSQQRVRTSELKNLSDTAASNILIVENEKCLHQLPPLPSTIAILGCGLNLSWMHHEWLNTRTVAYWGDIDTWGLTMLAKARAAVPTLTPLLMTREIFDQHHTKAVTEPTPSTAHPDAHLTPEEKSLHLHLLQQKRSRLEQEFIATKAVHDALKAVGIQR